jgi:hypothetical protein
LNYHRNKVTVSFTNVTVPGFYLVIDEQSRIQGIGGDG